MSDHFYNIAKIRNRGGICFRKIVSGRRRRGKCRDVRALAAREQGAGVIVLERAPESESGGNTRFTAGAIRFAYEGVEDLRALMPDLTEEGSSRAPISAATRKTSSSTTWRGSRRTVRPDLVELLVRRSKATMTWLRHKGLRFVPIYGRQAFKVDGRFKFWAA